MISIIVPTLGRYAKLERLLKSIEENAGRNDYEVIVVHDGEEKQDINYRGAKVICNAERLGVPRTLKRGVEESSGGYVMFLGNDCVPRSNFLAEAMVKMHEIGWGLVGLNDCYYPEGHAATHWLASKKLLPMLGGEFFCTLYGHTCCDNELTARCKKAGKYIWAEDAVVYHDHPVQTGVQEKDVDEVYKIAYNTEQMVRDKKLLWERAKEFDFEIISDKITHPEGYPVIKPCVDLRKKVGYGRGLKALNIGCGSCESDLMKQMLFMEFAELTHLDIHAPYLDHAKTLPWCSRKVNFVLGDVREANFEGYNVVMIFDVAEHIEKEESLGVIKRMLASPAKILIFIPIEKSFRENTFCAESQDHLSLWVENDFKQLGFTTEYLPWFHGTDGDALWAIREAII